MSRKEFVLDPRTVFVIQSRKKTIMWIGSQTHPSYIDLYIDCAISLFDRLKKFEGASKVLTIVHQGQEPIGFWKNFSIKSKNSEKVCRINKNWNNWFIKIDEEAKVRSARSHKSITVYAEREEIQNKPALFIYPFYMESLYVLDLDDLTEEAFAVLCDRQDQKVFIWKGPLFQEEEQHADLNLLEFAHLATERFFEGEEFKNLRFIFESSTEESDEFLRYFT